MARSTQKEIRQRAPVWLLVLLAFNFGLMSWDAKDTVTKQRVFRVWGQAALSPFQRAATGVGGTGVGFFQRIANMRNAEAENESLKERLNAAEAELRDARAARDQNAELQKMLDFKQEVGYSPVAASVIARDPSVWFNSIIINRGTLQGIDVNMPVATPDGIVGRIVAV
ncbi:MAG: rod shape-determining protein MreC, partial [Pyrinomonadaceae bacterium]